MSGNAPQISIPKATNAKVAIISSSWHLDICNDLIAGASVLTKVLSENEIHPRNSMS